MKNISIRCGVTFSTIITLNMLSTASAQEKETRSVRLKAACSGYAIGQDRRPIRSFEIVVKDAVETAKPLKFSFNSDSLSKAQHYKGEAQLLLKFANGKTKQVKIPQQGKDLLMLLTPSATSGNYHVHWVSLDMKNFKYGARKLFNLTKTHIGILAGKKSPTKTLLKAGSTSELNLSDGQLKELARFPIEFQQRREGKFQVFSTTWWTYSQKNRQLVFFFHSPKTKRMTYKAITDYKLDQALIAKVIGERSERMSTSLERINDLRNVTTEEMDSLTTVEKTQLAKMQKNQIAYRAFAENHKNKLAVVEKQRAEARATRLANREANRKKAAAVKAARERDLKNAANQVPEPPNPR